MYRGCEFRWKGFVVVEDVLVVHELAYVIRLKSFVLQPQWNPVLIVALLEKFRIPALIAS
jgi:hypothetical protein